MYVTLKNQFNSTKMHSDSPQSAKKMLLTEVLSYDLGDNEIHLAFTVDDMDAALAHHKEMNCVCFENESMGIYFIEDPDGYWLEIVPEK